MHAAQREDLILGLLADHGFVSFRDLDARLPASPASIRRDLERLAQQGRVERVRGGARLPAEPAAMPDRLTGVPFHENMGRNTRAKEAIGRAAAALCEPGEGIMIDGGSTTLQMCPHLAGMSLQVLTNSLHIVSALLPQAGTRILVPSGSVFREQNIILAAAGEESMPRFHAPKLFMGAAAVAPHGLMQADVVLVAAERRLIERADRIVVLADSSKFAMTSGNVVCGLDQIDTIVTDEGITAEHLAFLGATDVEVIIARP